MPIGGNDQMLFIFDVDGTLIRSFLRKGAPKQDFQRVELLPMRYTRILELVGEPRSAFALVTNQGGVAFGYHTQQQVMDKLAKVCRAFNLFHSRPFSVHVCYDHPEASIPMYHVDSPRRKPRPGMLFEAIEAHNPVDGVTYVGDLDSDREAAQAAKERYPMLDYVDAEIFFQ